MPIAALVFTLLLSCAALADAVEERIRGVLEKTAKTGACAQITDALKETYYVVKSEQAEKLCADLMGQRVVLTGVVEQQPGDPDYFLRLAKAERYEPKLPDAQGESPEASLPLPAPKSDASKFRAPQEEKKEGTPAPEKPDTKKE